MGCRASKLLDEAIAKPLQEPHIAWKPESQAEKTQQNTLKEQQDQKPEIPKDPNELKLLIGRVDPVLHTLQTILPSLQLKKDLKRDKRNESNGMRNSPSMISLNSGKVGTTPIPRDPSVDSISQTEQEIGELCQHNTDGGFILK